jgi:hypothetical protein
MTAPRKWADATPGNTLALRHGAYSEAAISAKAAEIRDALYEVAPWLTSDSDTIAVARFLRVEARSLLLQAAIERQSAERGGPDKVSAKLYEQATASDRLGAQLGHSLGLDPGGRAKLQQQVAGAAEAEQSIAELAEQGRLIRERREAEDAAAVDAVDEEATS